MAFSSLGSKVWGSGPAITFNFSYERQRSGANMKYRVKVVIESLTGPHYFGYPIYMKTSMNGSVKETKTLKSASPSQWSSDISYTTPWYTISNKTTGSTSLSLNIYSGSGNSRNNTYSFSMKVDPAASVLGSISNFTIGNAINIPITKYSDDFKDTLVISLGGTTIKTIDKITNGYDVNFSSSELNTIYSKLPTATSGSFTFKLTTKNGNSTVGSSSKTATGSISSNIKPSISNVGIAEAGSTPTSWGVYVKNKSKIKFTISASAGNGSSISSIKTVFNGSTYTGSAVTSNTINVAGNLTATITATDKRGRSASTTKTINIVDYSSPYISKINAYRCNSDGIANDKGTSIKIEIAGGISSISGKNTHSYKVQWKKSTDSGWKEYVFNSAGTSIDSSTIINSIESASSYEVKGIIADYFTSVNKSAKTIPSVFRTLSFKAGGHAIAIGKIAEEDNVFDIAMKTKFQDPASWLLRRGPWWSRDDTGKNADNVINEINFAYKETHNTPVTGTLITFSCASNIYPWQMIVAYNNSNEIWVRAYNGDGAYWKEWVKLLTTGNVQNTLSSTSTTLPLSAAQGKALNDKIAKLDHPVGSVVITSTNKNPSGDYGGTWTLIDQEFSSVAPTSGGFTAGTGSNTGSCYWSRSGHTITFEFNATAQVNIGDSDVTLGKIKLSTLGITRFNHTARLMGYSDSGNSGVMYEISTDGTVKTHDVAGDPYVASGRNICFSYTANIHKDYMVDSACNKFYWKRTA